MCYGASCSRNSLGMKCHHLKLEDLKIFCRLEFSSPPCPLQLDAGASSSSTGLYPSDNTPTVTLLIKSPALLRGV
ncbi:hypothetical protein DV515_00013460 [Chloebia gouldiae]|uniref:Uncharacterized protein n=1 Tax=Chloebia gouldiae TaxID=44316 RepID=A0A3L8S0V1_CHLGU|nr:hypothetical protein DV515_00013460 [Chloebia gouldiae]